LLAADSADFLFAFTSEDLCPAALLSMTKARLGSPFDLAAFTTFPFSTESTDVTLVDVDARWLCGLGPTILRMTGKKTTP
jgi:hypothetical protein